MAKLPALTPTTFGEAMQFAEVLSKSTMVPREYQRAPANVLVAIQWGAELGLGPLQALQNIAVINGKPSVYGDAMLALVRGSPQCEDVVERIEGDGDGRVAVCEARRKGSTPVIGRFSVNDAKRAGLWDKAGPWKQYPSRMLQMRARGFALRDAFPDVLRGVISVEEAGDYPRQMKDITPPQDPGALTVDLDEFAAPSNSTAAEPEPTPDAQAEDDLLAGARAAANDGFTSFETWYMELGGGDMDIGDAHRLTLRPHIKELIVVARQADYQRDVGEQNPEERQSSTPTTERKEPEAVRSPTDAAPRDESKHTAQLSENIEAADNDSGLIGWTRPALAECREPVEVDDLWSKHEKRYLRAGMAAQKEIRDMFKARNRELSA